MDFENVFPLKFFSGTYPFFEKMGNYGSNNDRKGYKGKNLAPNDVLYLLSIMSFELSE